MDKKDKEFKVDIDNSVVYSKAKEIGQIIEGLTLPYVLCILGIVITECVISALNQGYRIETIVSNWLKGLAKRVQETPKDIAAVKDIEKDFFGNSITLN